LRRLLNQFVIESEIGGHSLSPRESFASIRVYSRPYSFFFFLCTLWHLLHAAPMLPSEVFHAARSLACRVNFKVEAFDEKEKIAEGTHQRAIVTVARFATRVQAKASGLE
jgi:hypothetical protein